MYDTNEVSDDARSCAVNRGGVSVTEGGGVFPGVSYWFALDW